MKYIDMHVHTSASDGQLTPSQLIDYAFSKGLGGIAITDHDTIGGVEEAIIASKKYKDFIVIPGIELSTEFKGEEVHVLGYGIDYRSESLVNILSNLQKQRYLRAYKIIEKLQSLDFEIEFKDVLKHCREDSAIGRPHIAKALFDKKYVSTIQEAFQNYLSKDKPAYVPRYKLTPSDAVNIIKQAHGYVVLAHPGLLSNTDVIFDLIKEGMEGIEVYHSDHNEEQAEYYLTIARDNNLFITGGSDFHGPPGPNNHHGDLGSVKVLFQQVEHLLNK